MLDRSISWRQPTIDCDSASPPAGQAHPGSRSLDQDFAPEAYQPGRSPAGLGRDLAGFLHQPLHLHQPAEILLMKPHPGQGLDGLLEVEQGEGGTVVRLEVFVSTAGDPIAPSDALTS